MLLLQAKCQKQPIYLLYTLLVDKYLIIAFCNRKYVQTHVQINILRSILTPVYIISDRWKFPFSVAFLEFVWFQFAMDDEGTLPTGELYKLVSLNF